MVDLSVEVVRRYGRLVLMAPSPALNVIVATDNVKIGEVLTRAMTLRALPADENVRMTANFVTRIIAIGQVAFVAQDDYGTITNVTARIRVSGNSTVVATQDLGVPTPDANNIVVADVSATLSARPSGSYTVSILFTNPSGSTDSAESNVIAVPLS